MTRKNRELSGKQAERSVKVKKEGHPAPVGVPPAGSHPSLVNTSGDGIIVELVIRNANGQATL